MLCPVCKTVALQSETLSDNLIAKSCSQCGGRWLPSFQYWRWLDSHGAILPEKPVEASAVLPIADSGAGKICPECGHFLTHSKVGHGIDFCLDRCCNCGGIWFDKNEWEVLQSRNLHDEVHLVFSDSWQRRVREEDNFLTHEKRVETILGPDDYAKLNELAEWINSHPKRSTIIGYLIGKQ